MGSAQSLMLGSLNELDVYARNLQKRQLCVACQQVHTERFCQCDISSVIGGQILTPHPNTRQEDGMWLSRQREVGEIIEGLPAAIGTDFASGLKAPQYLGDF